MDTAADQCSCGGPEWVVVDVTDEEVICNGYLKGKKAGPGSVLPIVSAITCLVVPNEESFLQVMYQTTYNDDHEQNDSLCLPFQAEQHGVTFRMTPKHREYLNGKIGSQ